MDLWIRSQDRKRLIRCEELSVQEKNQQKFAVIIGNRHIIGTYKNKQRALEVIDEIHKLLVPQIAQLMEKVKKQDTKTKNIFNVYAVENCQTGQVDIRELSTLVYQMPEE